ncbi:pirin family protein [Paenibacillus selenitireducens]|uniref:Pirin family protein n=1 Tax=Paenibacillus selenitireducens TaxID=1324314 RepID=A0A1T2X6P0_9BACL|nr:pirin family protein [Paenibacillus selenitireducens]OPA75547.1 pirin family protein [Paenibacillus selenitireducens]
MIQVYPAASRYMADHGWLKSNFSFSFADYYDPSNMSFGPMRVLNDDFVAPLEGFGMHPHREMEIVSIVLTGKLEHRDSLGNHAVTGFGEVQRMSAGTGIYHSEMSASETETLNFLQMWFMPSHAHIHPSYETTEFDVERMKNALLPVVSTQGGENIASIHQDMTIYLSDIDADASVAFRTEPGRNIFFFVIDGEVTLNGEEKLMRRDSARITDVSDLLIQASTDARIMLIDLTGAY